MTPNITNNMDGHACLLPFDTNEPEFARGFEVGRSWALLRQAPHDVIEEYAHASNAEMMVRLGDATGRQVWSEELGDGWLLMTFEPQLKREPRANKNEAPTVREMPSDQSLIIHSRGASGSGRSGHEDGNRAQPFPPGSGGIARHGHRYSRP